MPKASVRRFDSFIFCVALLLLGGFVVKVLVSGNTIPVQITTGKELATLRVDTGHVIEVQGTAEMRMPAGLHSVDVEIGGASFSFKYKLEGGEAVWDVYSNPPRALGTGILR